MSKKRVLIFEFHQETNTFNPIVNPVERFNAGNVFEGQAWFEKLVNDKLAVGGAVAAITEAGGEPIPSIFMHSASGGRVADAALELMRSRLEYYIRTAGEFDAVYGALHGATCTESCDDACGDLLELVRSLVGDKPIAVSCDMHAKITRKMMDNADIICGYLTYPHVDHYAVGQRAGSLCMDMLAGKQRYSAVCQIPVLVPPAGYTTREGAYKDLMDKAKAMVEDGTLVDMSIFPVQPWLDIPELASTVLTVAEDPETAKQKAYELAQGLFDIRDEMWPDMKSVDEIIDIAEANDTGKPVILADSADSPNGGCVGDSPAVAQALQARGSSLKTAMFIRDAEAVEQAFRLGVGGVDEFSVGAGMTPGLSGPFRGEGTVVGLYVNDLAADLHPSIGKTAVVRFGNIYMVICKNGSSSPFPGMFRSFGIEPADCQLVVVKANTSFRAYFASMTDLIYVADTPGAGASNLNQMQWKNLPKGMYPFDLPEGYTPAEAKLW